MRLLSSVVCTLALCVFASSAWADNISVQNPSFETTNPLYVPCIGPETCLYNFGPVPGWTTISAGSFEPSSFYFSLPLPNGNVVAYTNGGSISQTLTGVSLLPNSTYTLSVDVGRRFDITGATYSISLTDGSNVFCSKSGSNSSIKAGTFADIVLTCPTGATVPAGVLGIDLTGGGLQVDFDNVRLNVQSGSVATPEPGALLLTLIGLAMGGLFFTRARRNRHLQSAAS